MKTVSRANNRISFLSETLNKCERTFYQLKDNIVSIKNSANEIINSFLSLYKDKTNSLSNSFSKIINHINNSCNFNVMNNKIKSIQIQLSANRIYKQLEECSFINNNVSLKDGHVDSEANQLFISAHEILQNPLLKDEIKNKIIYHIGYHFFVQKEGLNFLGEEGFKEMIENLKQKDIEFIKVQSSANQIYKQLEEYSYINNNVSLENGYIDSEINQLFISAYEILQNPLLEDEMKEKIIGYISFHFFDEENNYKYLREEGFKKMIENLKKKNIEFTKIENDTK
ncbi:TPA: hypothetical protein SMT55_000632 [Proteus mirabilis]|nr:hypothetical protein [Proteus mirabilis]HEK2723054.1 hypothetical protein [Proteus mirabilis]